MEILKIVGILIGTAIGSFIGIVLFDKFNNK